MSFSEKLRKSVYMQILAEILARDSILQSLHWLHFKSSLVMRRIENVRIIIIEKRIIQHIDLAQSSLPVYLRIMVIIF